MEAPRYKVLHRTFIAPHMVEPGSIIETMDAPGPHLQPINPAADLRFTTWLEEEFDEIDPRTMRKTGERIRPHMKYMRAKHDPAAKEAEFTLISEPPKAKVGLVPSVTDLASARLRSTPASMDPRPGPVVIPAEETHAGTTKIVDAAPAPVGFKKG